MYIFDNKICLVEKKSDYRLSKKKEATPSREKDKNMCDAINKVIKVSKGKVI